MSSNLAQKHCVPCEGGVPPMAEVEARRLLEELGQGWELAANHLSITKTFKFKDFKEAMGFLNRVAEIAEAEGHHPDITIRWNKVTFLVTTHAIKGLSENDFILAAKIEREHS